MKRERGAALGTREGNHRAKLISVPRKEGGEKARAGVEEDEDAVAGGVEGVPIYTSILNLLR